MPTDNPKPNPATRLYKATGHSIRGLKSAFKYEQAFRLEVYLFVMLTPIALWVGNNPMDYMLLLGSGLMVMIIELINSAIEAAIDRIGPEHHELSGRAKDIGSAAVMVGVILAAGIWVAVLFTNKF